MKMAFQINLKMWWNISWNLFMKVFETFTKVRPYLLFRKISQIQHLIVIKRSNYFEDFPTTFRDFKIWHLQNGNDIFLLRHSDPEYGNLSLLVLIQIKMPHSKKPECGISKHFISPFDQNTQNLLWTCLTLSRYFQPTHFLLKHAFSPFGFWRLDPVEL